MIIAALIKQKNNILHTMMHFSSWIVYVCFLFFCFFVFKFCAHCIAMFFCFFIILPFFNGVLQNSFAFFFVFFFVFKICDSFVFLLLWLFGKLYYVFLFLFPRLWSFDIYFELVLCFCKQNRCQASLVARASNFLCNVFRSSNNCNILQKQLLTNYNVGKKLQNLHRVAKLGKIAACNDCTL